MEEAGKMYLRARKGYEQALGQKHPSTLTTLNNLGVLYSDQSKLNEAEEMYQQALEGYEEALGPMHTSTLDTLNNLGVLYSDQGNLVKAEETYAKVLDGYEKALGPTHASTLNTLNNLGNLYSTQGKLVEAEVIYKRVLRGYDTALVTAALVKDQAWEVEGYGAVKDEHGVVVTYKKGLPTVSGTVESTSDIKSSLVTYDNSSNRRPDPLECAEKSHSYSTLHKKKVGTTCVSTRRRDRFFHRTQRT